MGERQPAEIIIAEPLGYPDMLNLMRHAFRFHTDSGGTQNKAYLLGVPYITLKEKSSGWGLSWKGGMCWWGGDYDKIVNTINCFNPIKELSDNFRCSNAKKNA